MSLSTAWLVLGIAALAVQVASAQQTHEHGIGVADAAHLLHFSHPIFTESISPDTKLRLDFAQSWGDEENESEVEFEGEYAFTPAISLQVVAPYVVVSPSGADASSRIGTVELAVKMANYAFAEHGVLVGYGMQLGLPTGSDSVGIGSDHQWDLGPFLAVGYKRGPIELVGRSAFGIPVNQAAGEEVETDLAYDFSGLYHVARRVEGMVELNGGVVLSGEAAGSNVVRLSPGVKVAPLSTDALFLGVGASFQLESDGADTQLRISAFYHF
jgi:hypothetical protein